MTIGGEHSGVGPKFVYNKHFGPDNLQEGKPGPRNGQVALSEGLECACVPD